MPRVAQSLLLRAGIARKKLDDEKREAVALYKAELQKPQKDRLGPNQIAAKFPTLSATTIWRLSKPDTRSKLEANEDRNVMSHACWIMLHDWLLEMADRALPVPRKIVKQKARAILRATVDPNHDGVSDSWIDRFYASPMCHDLSTHWSSSLTKDRARAVNPNTVRSWFEMIQRQVVVPGILPQNQYGMDETNFLEGQEHKIRVAGRKGQKNTYKHHGGSRKSCTVIVTICADGTVLKPTIIFKGTKLLRRWGEVNPLAAKYIISFNLQRVSLTMH